MENIRCKISRWGPVAVYAIVVFFLSSLSSSELPQTQISDKVLHLGVYVVFGFLIARAVQPQERGWRLRKSIVVCLLAALLYGISDEFHQSFVPGRSVETLDLLMDGVGGSAGGALFLYVHQIPGLKKNRRKTDQVDQEVVPL